MHCIISTGLSEHSRRCKHWFFFFIPTVGMPCQNYQNTRDVASIEKGMAECLRTCLEFPSVLYDHHWLSTAGLRFGLLGDIRQLACTLMYMFVMLAYDDGSLLTVDTTC